MVGLARALAVAVLVAVAATACSSGPTASAPGARTPTLTPSGSAALAPPVAHCARHGIRTGSGFPEIRGSSGSQASLWGLVFADYPVRPGTETKIVWRMTGSGPLAIRAVGPDGRRVRPAWGPELHTGSSWHRPGDEWGTGFRFPTAGCWTIQATRGTSSAVAGVLVS